MRSGAACDEGKDVLIAPKAAKGKYSEGSKMLARRTGWSRSNYFLSFTFCKKNRSPGAMATSFDSVCLNAGIRCSTPCSGVLAVPSTSATEARRGACSRIQDCKHHLVSFIKTLLSDSSKLGGRNPRSSPNGSGQSLQAWCNWD